jgi:hypothetical protein
MTQPQRTPALPRPLTIYLRPLEIAAVWLALVGLATGCFFAPRGLEVQPTLEDVAAFGCSLGITGAAAAIVAFGIGGRRRWAVELTLAVTILGVIAAALLIYFLWFDPTFARQKMNLWRFQWLQNGARRWAEDVAGLHAPLGVPVGIVLGTIAGLLTILGRRRPRLATGIALVVLFTFASTLSRQSVLDQITRLTRNILLNLRGWTSGLEEISITGMIFGGTAGSVIAGLAMYATRPRPSVLTTATPLQETKRERR